MRKFIVLSLVGLLVLAFGTIVYGQAKEEPKLEFKPSGFIDVITEWNMNAVSTTSDVMFQSTSSTYRPGGAGFDKKHGYMEQRGHLKFEAIAGKEVSGTIHFEMDSNKWGERDGTKDDLGVWGGDQNAVEIKNLFIDFAVPGTPIPVSVRAGLQGIAVRSTVFLSTDGTGVIATAKIDPATIRLIWAKPIENNKYASDDVDVYGVDASAKIGTFTLGGYAVNYNFNAYPFPSSDTSTIDYNADMWWLGLYADGKLGPVDIKFDLSFDTGKVEDQRDLVSASRARDVKYRGHVTRFLLDYPWEKFNFGTIIMYASGADTKKTDAAGKPGETTAWATAAGETTKSTRVDAYVVPPGAESQGGEALIFYADGLNRGNTSYGSSASTQLARRRYGGTWFTQFYASYKATPTYKITLKGMYIGDTTKHGNTIGNAVKADGKLRDDTSIGWEFDVINEIQIYKNLSWKFGAGVLFAGDAMDYLSTGTTNKSPKNPWAVASMLLFTF